jgi:Flp pilus assembly protein CpaB
VVVFAIGSLVLGRSPGGSTVPVVVAKNDIKFRTAIIAADLEIVPMPSTAVGAWSLTSIEEARNKVAQVDIAKGQPVTKSMVDNVLNSLDSSAVGFLPIPSGWVAMTIPTGEMQGVAGYVVATDQINVQATISSNSLGSKAFTGSITKILYENLRVIRIGPAVAPGSKATTQGVSSSLTVIVPVCEAPYLAWVFDNSTSVKYLLPSFKDTSPMPTGPNQNCPVGSPQTKVGVTGRLAAEHFQLPL